MSKKTLVFQVISFVPWAMIFNVIWRACVGEYTTTSAVIAIVLCAIQFISLILFAVFAFSAFHRQKREFDDMMKRLYRSGG